MERTEALAFEDEARRAAEAVWGLPPGDCQPAWYKSDPVLHELDGIARLRDVTHVLMVTTSTKLEKIQSDVRKLDAAARQESKRGQPVEKWLITVTQLNAEHIKFAQEHGVKTMTLGNFRSRFFDGRDYVAKRRAAPFGSARNLVDGSITIPEDEYVDLPMVECSRSGQGWTDGEPLDMAGLAARVGQGDWFVLVGPFGAGKSLTTREVFFRLGKRALKTADAQPIPVTVNLRDHWGAQYPDEILERHARSIGMPRREDLTIAWRSGIACLLLDGFDEVASQAIARTTDRNWMRQSRFEALQAVRGLIAELPVGSGLLVCGRDHYFDDRSELEHALALAGRPYSLVRLDEFTEAQASAYLTKHAGSSELPDWLPRKPLILGYLAHRGLLESVLQIDGTQGFGFVWDQFLDLICERESQHGRAAMDPQTVRRVLERLASAVRSTPSGTGPLTAVDIAESYRAETGNAAGEGVLAQLQRLPGLTPREQDPTARSFVDQELMAALQGSAVARAVVEGDRANLPERRWLDGLSGHGVHMAAHILRRKGLEAATVIAAASRYAAERGGALIHEQLSADCLSIAIEMAGDSAALDGRGLTLTGVMLPSLDLEDTLVKDVTIRDSLVGTLAVGRSIADSTVRFYDTAFAKVVGVSAAAGLPDEMFVGCTFEGFDDASTNAAVLRLNLSPPMKALLTILRKLYRQAGGGRRLNAFTRGLPQGPVSNAVPEVLEILRSEGLVHVYGEVAHPVRREAGRVERILATGELSDDPAVLRVQKRAGSSQRT
jgi:hypothetical protein